MCKKYFHEDDWYSDFEARIKSLVKSLHRFGIETIWCCEGHIRTEFYFTGILPWPWVIVHCTRKEFQKLETILGEWNGSRPSHKWILSERRIHGSLTPDYIRHTYFGIVRALVPAEENLNLSHDILAELQSSANELASFLASRS